MADLNESILATWRRHQEILMHLLDEVPRGGMAALPEGSRGRDVARQFAHLNRVRLGWLGFHETGERPALPALDAGKRPTKAQMRKALRESGKQVDAFLAAALAGEAKVRMFGKNPVRWMGYLISHESHHRGLIMIALKQSGMKLPPKVAVEGLWGKWMHGPDS